MPIYEYQCKTCPHRMEKLQKMSDPPLTMCPACGRDDLKKLVSAAAFRLKGGGWYETDFKQDGQRNLAGDQQAKSDSSEPSKTASDGSSDSNTNTTKHSTESGTSTQTGSGSSGTTANAASSSDSKPSA
ncbi:MAG: zinc ribbon domain-containing protein [Pseudomonadota bacterium]